MQMKMALPLKKFTGFQHWGVAGGVRTVFGGVFLERRGGSIRYVLPSGSRGLQARRWQCLGEPSFSVVLDF